MAVDYLSGLNQEQREAVKYGVTAGSAKNCGPLLVIAGAGTGKTKTLTTRVAHLIVNGIDPHFRPLHVKPNAPQDASRRAAAIQA